MLEPLQQPLRPVPMQGSVIQPVILLCILQGMPCSAAQSAALTQNAAPAALSSGILVLTTGELVEGSITPRKDGYDVRSAAGNRMIESARVSFTAASRPEAWRRLRATFQRMTPEIHLQLAAWCLRYDLKDQAQREVLDALQMDPYRKDARDLLRQLTARTEPSHEISPARHSIVRQQQLLPNGGAIPAPSRSLGGLSRPLAAHFVRHVQPLLSSKCATAGCHGLRPASDFQLSPVSRGSTPLIAERNLAAVLEQLNTREPNQSSLLLQADRPHGGMRTPVFVGRTGIRQRTMLLEWLVEVASDIDPQPQVPLPQLPAIAGSKSSQPALARPASVIQVLPASQDQLSSSRSADEAMSQESGNLLDIQFLKEARAVNARDPFNPDIFNRRHHGASAWELSRSAADASGNVAALAETQQSTLLETGKSGND